MTAQTRYNQDAKDDLFKIRKSFNLKTNIITKKQNSKEN